VGTYRTVHAQLHCITKLAVRCHWNANNDLSKISDDV